jgi:hypothetical protein
MQLAPLNQSSRLSGTLAYCATSPSVDVVVLIFVCPSNKKREFVRRDPIPADQVKIRAHGDVLPMLVLSDSFEVALPNVIERAERARTNVIVAPSKTIPLGSISERCVFTRFRALFSGFGLRLKFALHSLCNLFLLLFFALLFLLPFFE